VFGCFTIYIQTGNFFRQYEIEFRGASMSAVRLPFSNGADGDAMASGGAGSTIADSPWRRTPSVRRSKSQPRVAGGASVAVDQAA